MDPPGISGLGARRKPWLKAGQCQTMEQSAAAIPEGAWQEIQWPKPRSAQLPVQCPEGATGQQAQAGPGPPGYQGPKGQAPAMHAGAWQLHPLGFVGKTHDYSAKLNEMVKVLDFVQFGGPSGAGHWHRHPLWDRATSLAPVPAVIDFTHSTRAMLITVDPAPSRLRVPRTGGLGFGNYRSDESVNAASRPPHRFH